MSAFDRNEHYEYIINELLQNHFAVIDNFFDKSLINQLRYTALSKEAEFKKAAIGNLSNEQVVNEIRGDYIYWIDKNNSNVYEIEYLQEIENLINYLNKTCYLGIVDKEFHFAIYPEGTFYKRHLDVFKNDNKRRLSVILYLNEEEWNEKCGGELVIYKENQAIVVQAVSGRMVVFESGLLEHEVKTVTRKRISITGWLKTR